ncbi:MAG: threonine ammonia-lyase [Phyllobacterium sp.]
MFHPPTIDDVHQAAARLSGKIVETPLIESQLLNEKLGARLLFKPECLQRTGSFKFRGAYNKISSLTPEERKRGVVAFSSGNHAQGVAASAQVFGIPAIIIMPSDAPQIKIENTKAYGAEVVLYDRFGEDRATIAQEYIDERGMVPVPPYDDPKIIAGQGTIGLELVDQATALGAKLDIVITPAGGGGLISGISLAAKTLSPDTAIWGAEPEHFDDLRRSLDAGEPLSNEPGYNSICDAILTPKPGELTFPINRRNLAGAIAVPDRTTAQAMRDAATCLKLVVEPGGCVAFGAVHTGELDIKDKTIAIVLSGGNVDIASYAKLIGQNEH